MPDRSMPAARRVGVAISTIAIGLATAACGRAAPAQTAAQTAAQTYEATSPLASSTTTSTTKRPTTTTTSAAARTTSTITASPTTVTDSTIGQCWRGSADVATARQVGCDEPHDAEIVGDHQALATEERPHRGSANYLQWADTCFKEAAAYLGLPSVDDLPSATSMGVVTRSQSRWDAGDRTVVCWFSYTEPDTKAPVVVTGTAKGAGATLP